MPSSPDSSTRRKSLRTIDINNSLEPNAGLCLDKYILHQDKKEKESRRDHFREVAEISIFKGYENVLKRWESMLADYRKTGYAIKSGKATVQGRIVLGTGNESVLETAITLHRIYGVPYIPGSALKGLAASLARQHCGDDWIKTSRNYQTVFGNTAESGCVVFHDAMYVAEEGVSLSRNPLKRDVLTPHHREYYMGSAPPADWDDPNPVHFLSATGSYLVVIAASAGGDNWLNAVWQILKYALIEVGIGAKTSSGYGRLKLE
jgi:CRISPR-associated protein Cmr6